MGNLQGKVAWITGAGSGIGEAAAIALAAAGAHVVLTGRRRDPLVAVAGRIRDAGGKAEVEAGDMTVAADVHGIAASIDARLGRLDIMLANAGVNIPDRTWAQLTPTGSDTVIAGNLSSAFYCAEAALPIMRRQKGGVLIVTASLAGRFITGLSGAAYTAAKHGVVAMCHSINMEECVHNIRCTAVLPGEVATPILDKRPVPVSAEERARMVQAGDVGDLIRYIAELPPHVVINEVMIT
ncbi:MAG: SDR family NAD(P)-dependent oxidoreductase, partial [Rhodospirillales bacterium]|nr:SDR family NAD(P)-dependent oxidoreductase [Rhodospirillales bacterium]